MSTVIYTGAYIEILKIPNFIEEIEEEEFEYSQCKKKCGDHAFLTRKAKFCPMCGNPVKLVKRTIQVPHVPDMADVSEFLEGHALEWSNGWGMENRKVDKILIPEFSGKWGRRIEVDYDGSESKIPNATGYKAAFEKKWSKTFKTLDAKGIGYVVKEGMVVFEQD
jgi:hypothetical protein